MIEGSVTFQSIFEGIEFAPTKCHSNHPLVSNLTVSSDGNQAFFVVELKNVLNAEEVLPIAQSEVDRLADTLSFQFGKPISQLGVKSQELRQFEVDASGQHTHYTALAQMLAFSIVGASATVVLGPESLKQLGDMVGVPNPPGLAKHKMFRDAIAAQDAASKFLGLYQLLASMCNDDQGTIDGVIRGVEPNTEYLPTKPKRKNGVVVGYSDETIYTRLRNEYSHDRHVNSLAKTREEIVANLDNFTMIVQTAIKKKV